MSDYLMLLEQTGRGRALEEANEQMGVLIRALQQRGGKGSITVQIKLEAQGPSLVASLGSVKIAAPRVEVGQSVFFTTPEGHLSRTPGPDAAADMLREMKAKSE